MKQDTIPKLLIAIHPDYDYESIRLHKFIAERNFETIDAYQHFANNEMLNKTPEEVLHKFGVEKSNRDLANQLAITAWEANDREAKKIIKMALKLDPENVEAHIFLAFDSIGTIALLNRLQKAISLAADQLGEDYFEKYTGHFWLEPQSRPYMFARLHFVEALIDNGKLQEAIVEMEDMIELNPTDNQGVRDRLAPIYVAQSKFGKYKGLRHRYQMDASASSAYTYLAFLFATAAPEKKIRAALENAINENKYVLDYFAGDENFEEIDFEIDTYTPGEKSEAWYCLQHILPLTIIIEPFGYFIAALRENKTDDTDKKSNHLRVVK